MSEINSNPSSSNAQELERLAETVSEKLSGDNLAALSKETKVMLDKLLDVEVENTEGLDNRTFTKLTATLTKAYDQKISKLRQAHLTLNSTGSLINTETDPALKQKLEIAEQSKKTSVLSFQLEIHKFSELIDKFEDLFPEPILENNVDDFTDDFTVIIGPDAAADDAATIAPDAAADDAATIAPDATADDAATIAPDATDRPWFETAGAPLADSFEKGFYTSNLDVVTTALKDLNLALEKRVVSEETMTETTMTKESFALAAESMLKNVARLTPTIRTSIDRIKYLARAKIEPGFVAPALQEIVQTVRAISRVESIPPEIITDFKAVISSTDIENEGNRMLLYTIGDSLIKHPFPGSDKLMHEIKTRLVASLPRNLVLGDYFQPEGMKALLQELPELSSIKDSVTVCKNYNNLSEEITKFLNDDTEMQRGFLVQRGLKDDGYFSQHFSPVFIDKTGDRTKILVTDSMGKGSVYEQAISESISEGVSGANKSNLVGLKPKLYYSGPERQRDSTNCAIFSMTDMQSIFKMKDTSIFESLDKLNKGSVVVQDCVCKFD
ncbi:hypothetical protein SCG7086_DS_00010 [Chlamydiales bacterium SCGC AG-110-P3]|nr:hypothetical protein SCG7086_DS_00010 [Chlamydiales bacterium SCGC AG-110-P3]